MKISKARRVLAGVAVLAVAAAACGDDGDDPGVDPTGDATGDANGIFSTYIIEPEHLSVANTNESEGNAVMRSISKGLIDYTIEDTDPFNQVAESIESDDFQTFTVTVADGWTFHNGEDVTAASFVDSWNYNSFGPNGSQVAGFFSAIDGYADLQCGTVTETDDEGVESEVPDCENQPPAAETLTGLAIDADNPMVFTITLGAPNPQFTLSLGYLAYHPVPSVFYDDPEGFEEAPIGNGPFMIDGTWEHDVLIKVRRYDDYAGSDPAMAAGIDFQIYADDNAALQDLRDGNLDIVDSVPPDELELVKGEFPDTFGETPQNAYNYLGFPDYLFDHDDPEMTLLRRALSMSVDSATNTATVLSGAVDPADSVIPPAIPGSRANTGFCENWTYDPDTAADLFDQAGGMDFVNANFPDGLIFWFNSGSVHELWTEAIANSWTNILGIPTDVITFNALEFSEYLPVIDARELTGPYRLGWGMDYPSPQNFLFPLFYSTQTAENGGSNSSIFASTDFDGLIDQGDQAATLEEGIPFYQQAEDILCDVVPVRPHHFSKNLFVTSSNVSGVYVDAFGDINYTHITVTS